MSDDRKMKSSSAPSRISSRDDIWKDIRDWAKPNGRSENDEDEGGGDQGRIIGSQIKDNVTEQRLLESRLFDLSKERYKFIVHVAWQRKAFIDKQKSKTSNMKDLLRNVDITDTTSLGAQKGKNLRSRLNEKLDSYRDLVRKTYSEERKKELLKMDQETGPDEIRPIIPGTYDDPLYKTEPTFSARAGKNRSAFASRPRGGPQNMNMFPAIQPPDKSRQQNGRVTTAPAPPPPSRRGLSRMSSTSRLPDPTATRQGAATSLGHSHNQPGISPDRIPRYLKYRSVYDGRFKGLERSLSASYDGKSGSSIESILNGLPSRSMSIAL